MKEIKTATGEIIRVRESRIEQVQDFLESGEQEREIPVHESEFFDTVRAALYNAVNQHKAFRELCCVKAKDYHLYLVRK